MSNSALSRKDRFWLRFQSLMGRICLFPLGLFVIFLIKSVHRLKIRNHPEIRKKFRAVAKEPGPLLICSNHLTFIDSILLIWALAPLSWYFLNYRRFPWNLPAIENFKSKWSWRLVTYLGKCIAVDRSGSPAHLDLTLEKIKFLLLRGETCMIFPEGTRSRTGRVEVQNVTYGTGRIIRSVPDCKVLCVYMRGDHQITYSTFPHKGDSFFIEMGMLLPESNNSGLRLIKDYSRQVIIRLKEMEDKYMDERSGSPHGGREVNGNLHR